MFLLIPVCLRVCGCVCERERETCLLLFPNLTSPLVTVCSQSVGKPTHLPCSPQVLLGCSVGTTQIHTEQL